MSTADFVKDLAKVDRDDRDLTRFGALPFVVRKVGVADFSVEDTRLWSPSVARVTSLAFAIEYVAVLVDTDRKAG